MRGQASAWEGTQGVDFAQGQVRCSLGGNIERFHRDEAVTIVQAQKHSAAWGKMDAHASARPERVQERCVQ